MIESRTERYKETKIEKFLKLCLKTLSFLLGAIMFLICVYLFLNKEYEVLYVILLTEIYLELKGLKK